MTRAYLILVDGKLAKRKLTFVGAKQSVKDLQARGYKSVSIAMDIKEVE